MADRLNQGPLPENRGRGRNYNPKDLALEEEAPTPCSHPAPSTFRPWIPAVPLSSCGAENNSVHLEVQDEVLSFPGTLSVLYGPQFSLR